MENIQLNFIPSDFDDNSYMNHQDCPIARACKRQFGWGTADIGGTSAGNDEDGYIYKITDDLYLNGRLLEKGMCTDIIKNIRAVIYYGEFENAYITLKPWNKSWN